MKMRLLILALIIVGSFSLTGCLTAPFIPPTGSIFTSIEAPLDLDANKTEVCAKGGEASSMCILGMVAVGDCSIQTAAKNGGLSTIEHVDYEYFNVLGIYQNTTVKVHGK